MPKPTIIGDGVLDNSPNYRSKPKQPTTQHTLSVDNLNATYTEACFGIMAGNDTTRPLSNHLTHVRDNPSLHLSAKSPLPGLASNSAIEPKIDQSQTLTMGINSATCPILWHLTTSLNRGDKQAHGAIVPDHAVLSHDEPRVSQPIPFIHPVATSRAETSLTINSNSKLNFNPLPKISLVVSLSCGMMI